MTNSLSDIPGLYRSKIVLRARRHLHSEFKTEQAVHMLHEIEQCLDFSGDLCPPCQQRAVTASDTGSPATAYKTRVYHLARSVERGSTQSAHPRLHSCAGYRIQPSGSATPCNSGPGSQR